MAINKKSLEMVVENVKDFFKNFMSPNMTIEDIADVASMRLDNVILANEAKGLTYSAGKFRVNYVDDEHFRLEFEMYFKDADDKWHKLANESELRDINLLEIGAQKTVKVLKVIEFPIDAPKSEPKDKPVTKAIESETIDVKADVASDTGVK